MTRVREVQAILPACGGSVVAAIGLKTPNPIEEFWHVKHLGLDVILAHYSVAPVACCAEQIILYNKIPITYGFTQQILL